MSAIEEAGYSPDSRGWLMKSVKDEIIDRAKTQLAGSSVKAINRLTEGLDADGTIPSGQMDVRMKAASEILDRTGISKRQEVNVNGQMLHGVVMLPAKDKIKTIRRDVVNVHRRSLNRTTWLKLKKGSFTICMKKFFEP